MSVNTPPIVESIVLLKELEEELKSVLTPAQYTKALQERSSSINDDKFPLFEIKGTSKSLVLINELKELLEAETESEVFNKSLKVALYFLRINKEGKTVKIFDKDGNETTVSFE